MSFFLLILIAVCVVIKSATSSEVDKFPFHRQELLKYSISDVTVSGISSGGYFAVQLHMAHSSIINGSATFAAGPFYCAESSVTIAENRCMDTTLGPPQVDLLVAATANYHLLGLIDSPANLADDHIYIFSGSMDTVVEPKVVHSLYNYYQTYTKTSNIVADFNIPAEHCIPTLDYGEQCSTLSSPYIGKCGFDGAGAAFKTLFGANIKPAVPAIADSLKMFSQKPFFPAAGGNSISVGENGYIYVPKACETSRCRLHVSFHGCLQNLDLIGPEYATHSGFNSWAEANNIIVLYPYAITSQVNPMNPNGCWDWWAYNGVEYGLKTGAQITFVKKMIDHIKGL
jgi:hypothetical protein